MQYISINTQSLKYPWINFLKEHLPLQQPKHLSATTSRLPLGHGREIGLSYSDTCLDLLLVACQGLALTSVRVFYVGFPSYLLPIVHALSMVFILFLAFFIIVFILNAFIFRANVFRFSVIWSKKCSITTDSFVYFIETITEITFYSITGRCW